MSSKNIDLNKAIKNTLVIVLAGGRGSRLEELTLYNSKPATPFGGYYRIIDFPLSNCINSGFRKIALVTQYQAHILMEHVQEGWNFLNSYFDEWIRIWPAEQKPENSNWYKGTADAVYQNLKYIKRYKPEYVMILSGDHIYKQDYSKMLSEHINRNAVASVSCLEVDQKEGSSFGCVQVNENGVITEFIEKPENPPCIPGREGSTLISQGNYIFNYAELEKLLIEDAENKDSKNDFGFNILPKLTKEGNLYAHEFSSSCITSGTEEPYWRDVGTIDSFWQSNMDLCDVTPNLNLYNDSWPILTNRTHSAPVKLVFDDDGRRGSAVDSLISGDVIISGSSVKHSILFVGVRLNSYTTVENSVIMRKVKILRNCKIRKAIISSFCVVKEGTVIGYDLEEDKKFFRVTEGGIVLVTQDMLEEYYKVKGI